MAGTISELFEGMITRPAQQTQQAQIDPALQLAQLVGKPGAFAAYYSGQRNQAMANAGRNISDAMSGGQYSSGAKITPDQLPAMAMEKISQLDPLDKANQKQIMELYKVVDPTGASSLKFATNVREREQVERTSMALSERVYAARKGAEGNPGALAELDALDKAVQANRIDVTKIDEIIDQIYTRNGVTEEAKQRSIASNTVTTPLKSVQYNYDIAGKGFDGERTTLALPTREDGMVMYQGVWQLPEKFGGVKRSDTVDISGVGGRTLETPLERRQRASQINVLTQLGMPFEVATQQVMSRPTNDWTTAELEASVTAYKTKANEASARMSTIEAIRPTMDNINLALGILSDPAVDDWNGVGGFSGFLESIPNTMAHQYRNLEEGITSGVILAKMGELKAQSSTGATGFGAMNIREFESIENALGSWDPNATPEHKKRVLEQVQFHFRNIQQINMGRPPIIKQADIMAADPSINQRAGLYADVYWVDSSTGKHWLDLGTGTYTEVIVE